MENKEVEARCYKILEYSFALISIEAVIIGLLDENLAVNKPIFLLQLILAFLSSIFSIFILNETLFSKSDNATLGMIFLIDSLLLLQIMTAYIVILVAMEFNINFIKVYSTFLFILIIGVFAKAPNKGIPKKFNLLFCVFGIIITFIIYRLCL